MRKPRLTWLLPACLLMAVPGAWAQTITYTYDAAGRVTSAVTTGGHTVTYVYDANGNRTQKVISGGTGGPNAGPTAVADTQSWPVIVGGGYPGFPTSRNVFVLANDTDPDGDALTITAVTTPTNTAVAVIRTNGLGHCVEVTNIKTTGTTFNYTISDGHSHTATATVTLNPTREDYCPPEEFC